MSHWHRGQAGQRGGASYEALTGASTPTTTQIYTNVGQERMEQVVGRL